MSTEPQRVEPHELATVHLVPLTPFDANGDFLADVHRQQISRLSEAGLRSFLPAAATSGFYQLSAREIAEIVRVTVEAARPRAHVFAPVGLNLRDALEIGAAARDVGASGLMFMPAVGPYLSDAGLRDYYLTVSAEVGLPCLVYKKVGLPSHALLLELASRPEFVGVKYSDPDVEHFHGVAQSESRIAWICGLAERYAVSFMLQGAIGFTSGAGNLVPKLALAIHEAAMRGDFTRAVELQRLLLPIERFRGREGDSYNVSMLQHAMTRLAEPLDFGRPRAPMRQLTREERAEIDAMLEPILAAEQAL